MRSAMRIKCFIIFIIANSFITNGQVKTEYNLAQLFKEKELSVIKREAKIVKDTSRESIVLNEDVDEGLVWLNGVSFSTGTIEIDLKGQDVYQHSFLGIAFHGVNDSTFEAIYFRPFQFLTTDSVRKTRGVQYISLPEYTWQVLREKYYGIYEKPVDPAPNPNDWFHAKLEVKENEVLVYVNNASTPCLQVKLKSGRKTGGIALYTADRSGGAFANLSVQK